MSRRAPRLLGAAAVVVFFSSCLSSSELELKRARRMLVEKRTPEAVAVLSKIADQPGGGRFVAEAAFEAARALQYDLKDFKQAVDRYRQVIRVSADQEQRKEAQLKIAAILFYDLQDFSGAISEYSKLLALNHSKAEEIEWRGRLAKAYYYKGDYFQSRVEADRLIEMPLDQEETYQVQLLKANIAVGAKEHERAAKVLEEVIDKFPQRAQKDALALMLAVAYEEQQNFDKAVETLEKFKSQDPRKSFFDEKIRSLRERQSQRPGARGFRK